MHLTEHTKIYLRGEGEEELYFEKIPNSLQSILSSIGVPLVYYYNIIIISTIKCDLNFPTWKRRSSLVPVSLSACSCA